MIGQAVAAVVLLSLAGCATAPTSGPRRMQADDFKWLAGEWKGSSYIQAEPTTNITGVIYENGSFFIAPRGMPGAQQPGQIKIVDGEALYETPTSQGKMVFLENATEWIWQWQGKTKIGDKAVTHELRKSK
ncbi:MAG TPA: hypothetical protein VIE44_11295 [Methylomirabilota bacterium]